jgi:hypothetical protein
MLNNFTKKRFYSEDEAKNAAIKYSQLFFSKEILGYYKCNIHRCWHLGHTQTDIPYHIRIQRLIDSIDSNQ